MMNYNMPQYDYYGVASKDDRIAGSYSSCINEHVIEPCKPCPGLQAHPAPPWDKAIAEHNLDHSAHPYLLELLRDKSSLFFCKDTLAERDAIGEELRRKGLLVYVTETDALYYLKNGIKNTDWAEWGVNSEKYTKLGRYNPPNSAENGVVYFDLGTEHLKIYMNGWVSVPRQKDIVELLANHNIKPGAHEDRFREVENVWLAI